MAAMATVEVVVVVVVVNLEVAIKLFNAPKQRRTGVCASVLRLSRASTPVFAISRNCRISCIFQSTGRARDVHRLIRPSCYRPLFLPTIRLLSQRLSLFAMCHRRTGRPHQRRGRPSWACGIQMWVIDADAHGCWSSSYARPAQHMPRVSMHCELVGAGSPSSASRDRVPSHNVSAADRGSPDIQRASQFPRRTGEAPSGRELTARRQGAAAEA
jgi:hypothetical protein